MVPLGEKQSLKSKGHSQPKEMRQARGSKPGEARGVGRRLPDCTNFLTLTSRPGFPSIKSKKLEHKSVPPPPPLSGASISEQRERQRPHARNKQNNQHNSQMKGTDCIQIYVRHIF